MRPWSYWIAAVVLAALGAGPLLAAPKEMKPRKASMKLQTLEEAHVSTIHGFYRRHRVTFKKRRRMPANRNATT